MFLADDEVAIQKIEESTDFYEMVVEYPDPQMVGSEEVSDFIKSEVSNFKSAALNQEEDSRIVTLHSFNVDIQNYQSSEYFSHVLFISEYTGGANVNQVVESFVYDRESGDRVFIRDILSESEISDFVEKVKNDLYENSEEKGIFPNQVADLSIDSFGTFYVTDRDISVLFSKYVVAAGAAGIIEVTIPREEQI